MNKLNLSEKKFTSIIDNYKDSLDIMLSQAYRDGGAVNPFPRLHRAMLNQLCGETGATLSRYSIWANTVRDNILEALCSIETDTDKAKSLLTTAINSLSCFSDIQAEFDPYEMGDKNAEPKRISISELESGNRRG